MSVTLFDLQPTLNGFSIQLRPLELSDFDELYNCASDPKIWEQHPQTDRYKKEVFENFFYNAIESKGALVVIDLKSGFIIGSSRYYNLNSQTNQITIGYTFLIREYWSGAYNRELKQLMLDYAFQYVERVLFEIGKNNIRSINAINKIGAKLVEKVELDKTTHFIYEIKKNDYLQS